MRGSGWFVALLVAGCSAPNPFFELAPGDGSGFTATDVATTQGSTTSISTSSSGPGADPSGVSIGDSATSTGVEPGTSTGLASSTGAASSTGEMQCTLTPSETFDEYLYRDGEPFDFCAGQPWFLTGRLLAGQDELRFATTDTGCPFESKFGTFALGKGYSLPVAANGPCAALFLYTDGDGPACDIGAFSVFQPETQTALASGSFTPQDAMNAPVVLLTPAEKLLECCTVEAQDCCVEGTYGDLALVVDGVEVAPGEAALVPVAGGKARLANIQAYQTGDCPNNATLTRRDWAAVRL